MPRFSPRADGPSNAATDERPVPKAPSYPGWVGNDEAARERYDLALAIAAEAVQEPPHSAAARMAAEVVFRMPQPTR